MKKLCVLTVMLMAAASAALADGVTDFILNPDGVFTISTPGHYRLVADVQMNEDLRAIVVTADNVTLDLNGHTITAAGGSFLTGIDASVSNRTVISGGTIIGFGDWGIHAGNQCRVVDCIIDGNNKTGNSGGLRLGSEAIVKGNTVRNNTPISPGTTIGIWTGEHAIIEGNNVTGNNSMAAATGISCDDGSVVERNVVANHIALGATGSARGIDADSLSTIRGNVCRGQQFNGSGAAVGIDASSGSLIESNTCSAQTCGPAASGTISGIIAVACSVLNNECSANIAAVGSNVSSRGINAGQNNLIRGNHCSSNQGSGSGNSAGIAVVSSNRVSDNLCAASTGGMMGHGIRVTGTSNFIERNNILGNSTAGLLFELMSNNRTEANRIRQTTGVDVGNGTTPASTGAGDLADILY